MNILVTAVLDVILSLPTVTVYLLYALGIVVIYRASRVLNLAHGAMAMVPAYIFYSLTKHGVHPLLGLLLSVVASAAFGVITERMVVRRLRAQGPTAQTVGTVAVFGLAVAVVAKIYGTAPIITASLFPRGILPIGRTGLRYGQIEVFVLGVMIAAGLFALFRFTSIGLAMRGSADNRRGATLMGVDVERTTQFAWALGGGLAGLAGVLVGSLTNIHPYTLSFQVLPAFVAVLLGGLESLPGTIVGSAVVGLVQGEIPALTQLPYIGELAGSVGFPDLVLMVVTFVVMGLRGARLVGSKVRDEAFATVAASRPEGAGSRVSLRPLAFAVVLLVAAFPFLPFIPFSILGDGVLAAFFLIVALSLVLLTGWVGQISLAQAEFVGVGAFITAVFTNTFHVPFPISFFLAMAVGGMIAAGLGVVALRVRGLYLAVATLVFAVCADNFLFNAPWFGVESGSATVKLAAVGSRVALPYFDFNDIRLVYLLMVAFAAFCIYGLANLRESKTGRAFFAVRGSEVAAASLGIDVTRYKLLAFLLAGMMAGGAGNLYIVYLRSVVPESFNILVSLFFVSVAVVGGLLSLGGAIVAAIIFAALQEVFFRVQQLAGFLNIVSALLLLGVLLIYPGGMAAIPSGIERLWRRLDLGSRLPLARLALPVWDRIRAVSASVGTGVASLRASLPAPNLPRLPGRGPAAGSAAATSDSLGGLLASRTHGPTSGPGLAGGQTTAETERVTPAWEGFRALLSWRGDDPRPETVVLKASGITVRFGGLTAVDDASLEVREGEIVGLIGPNGAGKTTMFNAITGLVEPTAGTVELFGRDITSLPVHRRAAQGVARTFQDIQLFPQLDVFENLLVATHVRNHSFLPQHLLVTPAALIGEAQLRARVRFVLDFLGLRWLEHRRIGDLSFGYLRLVEVARALVTGAKIIMLDEPASGLDNTESKRLVELLLYVRKELSVTMLVVEHDIPTVVALSDYMYVLDQGKLISEGRPAVVQQDARVIEGYLGQAVGAAT
ncbi:MAG: ABC transporter permease subunit [Candidatus Dormibacteria bacterium]